jgi:hypothetical protein
LHSKSCEEEWWSAQDKIEGFLCCCLFVCLFVCCSFSWVFPLLVLCMRLCEQAVWGVCYVCLEERNPKVFLFFAAAAAAAFHVHIHTYAADVPAIQEAWKSNLTKQKIILVLASCRRDLVSFQSQDSWLLLYLSWSGDGSSLGSLSWKLPR